MRSEAPDCSALPAVAVGRSARMPGFCIRLGLVALSNLLIYLALPGQPYPLLAMVCLVPLGLALHGASRQSAALLGFVFGFFGWLGSVAGLANAARGYLELSHLESTLYVASFCLYSALPYAGYAYLFAVFQWLRQPLGVVVCAASFTLILCLFPSPMPMSPEAALYPLVGFIQILDLGGRPLLLFVLAMINWSLVALLVRLYSGVRVGGLVMSIMMLIVVVMGYGEFRLTSYAGGSGDESGTSLAVASIQPNFAVSPQQPQTVEPNEPGNLEVLLAMSEQVLLANPDIELLVWPETPERIDCAVGAESRAHLRQLALRYHAAFIVSCAQPVPHQGDYNASMLVSREGVVSTYNKQILFPFAEFLPGESALPILRKILPGAANYIPGQDSVLFEVPAAMTAFSSICYEVLFSHQVWKFVKQGGELLVNPANDVWFGDSRIADFMVAAAVFRAVEFRVPVLRVSNSGDSLLVRRSGYVEPESLMPNNERGFRVSRIANIPSHHHGFYPARLFTGLLVLVWLLDLVARFLRKR